MPSSENLTKIAARGTAWVFCSSLAVQVLSLLAQAALGWYLSDHDFGLYALAIGITSCVQIFRDGGISLWLARKPHEEFSQHVSQAFWFFLLCSVAVSAVLLLVAPGAAIVYRERQVGILMAVVAAAMPFEPYAVVAEADLQVALRFRSLAVIRTLSALVRYTLSVAFAITGFGPLSFVLPLIPLGILRCAFGYGLTRLQPWRERPSMAAGQAIFESSRWVLIGTFGSAVFRQIDYLVLGLVSSTALVGLYFFAYQLSVQPVLLFSQSLRRVLVPAFSRVDSDRERQQRAVIRAGAVIGLAASAMFLYLSLIADTVEYLIWQGKWAKAAPLISILAAVMPMHLFALFTRMIIQARGKFRMWGLIVFVRSIGLALVVIAAASLFGRGNVTAITWGVAVYLALSSLGEAVYILRSERIEAAPVLKVVLPPYLLVVVLTAILIGVTPAILPQLPTTAGAIVKTAFFVPALFIAANTLFSNCLQELKVVINQF